MTMRTAVLLCLLSVIFAVAAMAVALGANLGTT
jgi:hypothetical protein